jgi:hypothetical protein
VYVSSDLKHDTYFVQHCFRHLQQRFKLRGKHFDRWFIDTGQ